MEEIETVTIAGYDKFCKAMEKEIMESIEQDTEKLKNAKTYDDINNLAYGICTQLKILLDIGVTSVMDLEILYNKHIAVVDVAMKNIERNED